ncbi:MAG: FAD-dependent oxidoreductase [Armatimonadetes bacterium]|nr:FAD-dependent oxidoreductase [Armatimonadota bacterium]MDE2207699.1 FAD-dependent oxidoreductase [Armatimonadota bacterium]
MSRSGSVVVIGGGVVGCFIALNAARAGLKVRLLERGAADDRGCSFGNAGMVVPSHIAPLPAPGMVGAGLRMLANPRGPFAIRPRPDRDLLSWLNAFRRFCTHAHTERCMPILRDLHRAAQLIYSEHKSEWPQMQLRESGLLMLCATERGFEEEARAAARANELGVTAEVLSAAEADAKLGSCRFRGAGAAWFRDDCTLSPEGLMRELRAAAEQAGVVTSYGAGVDAIEARGVGVTGVRIGGETLPADSVVLAAGSWSAGLLRPLGIRLLLQAGKGCSFTLPEASRLPAVGAILTEARVAVTPMGSGVRFAGTMEIAGLDPRVNQRRAAGMRSRIPRYFPQYRAGDFVGLPVWSGLRPCTPDGLPVIGRCSSLPNLIVATGHAMMGISLAPITARLVTQLLRDEPPEQNIAPFAVERFESASTPAVLA